MHQFTALAPLRLPIFDFIYQKSNNFNESIHDTNAFLPEYDFIVIGSGSGKANHFIIKLNESLWNLIVFFSLCQVVPLWRID